jgi:hypothetical protein
MKMITEDTEIIFGARNLSMAFTRTRKTFDTEPRSDSCMDHR